MTCTDREPLYSTLAAEPDFAELVCLFVEEMPGRVEGLRSALERRDWEELRRLAHQLKGAGGGYGFEPITLSAARLEAVIRCSLPEAIIRQAAEELVQWCNRAEAAGSR
jgi:HPt (histidine-containing phosphotransfer) domain-containing protein